MSDPTITRTRVLSVALELFRRQGVAATSLQEIADRAGVGKGSLHFHFPGGKRELAVEAAKLGGVEIRDAMAAGFAAQADFIDAFRTMVEMVGAVLEGSDFQIGSPISTIALELGAQDEAVRQACARGYFSWGAAVAERLMREGMAPEVAGETCLLAGSALDGALIASRILRSLEPLNRVREQLITIIDERLTAARAAGAA